jgi:hypothetical protein
MFDVVVNLGCTGVRCSVVTIDAPIFLQKTKHAPPAMLAYRLNELNNSDDERARANQGTEA